VTPEPPGSNCADGGERIDIGAIVDGGFDVQETAYVCNGSGADAGAGPCTPNALRCLDQQSQQCNSGTWTSIGASCAASHQACVEGACVGVCTPATTQCNGTFDEQTCSAGGQWAPPVSCGVQTPICDVAACSPPMVNAHGGPVLSQVEVVPVYYSDFQFKSEVSSIWSTIFQSGYEYWLNEYSSADGGTISAGGIGPSLQINGPAPANVTPSQIESLFTSLWNQGRLQVLDNSLFVLYLDNTQTLGTGLCATLPYYRDTFQIGTHNVSFAVVATCSGFFGPGSDGLSYGSSAALLGGVTDPYGPGIAQSPAWEAQGGRDIAFLCSNIPPSTLGNYLVAKGWSRVAFACR
jgi:hypothetical protein